MRKENNDMKKTMQSMVKVVQQISQKNSGGGRTNPNTSKPQFRGSHRNNGGQRQRQFIPNGPPRQNGYNGGGRPRQNQRRQQGGRYPSNPNRGRGFHGDRRNGGRNAYRR